MTFSDAALTVSVFVFVLAALIVALHVLVFTILRVIALVRFVLAMADDPGKHYHEEEAAGLSPGFTRSGKETC